MGGLFHNLRHPRRCYVVCAIARSGSNLLTDGLHMTRRAGRPKQFFLPSQEAHHAAKSHLDSRDFAGYVRGIIPATATSNEVFGFKLMVWYLKDFLRRLRETNAFGGESASDLEILRNAFPRLEFIQIVRRNKVRQAISRARAGQTGLWKLCNGKKPKAEPSFDPRLISNCLAEATIHERMWKEFFDSIAVEPFRVEYEQLCEDYENTLRRVLDYLQVSLPRGSRIGPPGTVRQADEISAEWEERFLALHPQLQPALL
jgi:LPS sulfotransferase NodH